MELNLKERQKLTKITAKKYRVARKKEKTKILDTFIEQTKYGRKYAIHILANEGIEILSTKKVKVIIAHKGKSKRIYPVNYDKDVQDALIPIWEAFNFQCGKLLAPFLYDNIDNIILDSGFNFDYKVITKLRKISAATIDRLIKSSKEKLKELVAQELQQNT